MLKDELRMLAGVVTEDMDYIGYLLLKDGSYFEEKEEPDEKPKPVIEAVESLENWFKNI
jgi:hypothetical protein